jgi:N-acetylneuraminate synthase/N,N'-diacetyllegionaminate synthase
VILSTGTAVLEEVEQAVAWFAGTAGDAALAERLALMHCISAYPTPIEQANVRSVPFLKQHFGLTTGFSNHVVGPEAVLAAVALGAQLIEVHFTDQKEGRTFRDHALSFDADDLAALVNSVARVRASLGTPGKSMQPCEDEVRLAIRKGVVAARDLAVGTTLTEDDLMYARPATEFPAGELSSLVGRTAIQEIAKGNLIRRDAVR